MMKTAKSAFSLLLALVLTLALSGWLVLPL